MLVFNATTAEEMRQETLRYLDFLLSNAKRDIDYSTGRARTLVQARHNCLHLVRHDFQTAMITPKGEK